MNKIIDLYPIGSVEYRLAQSASCLNQLFFEEENRKMMAKYHALVALEKQHYVSAEAYYRMTQQLNTF